MRTFEAQEPAEATHENVGRRNDSIEQHRFTKTSSPVVIGAKISEQGEVGSTYAGMFWSFD
jgi:hypothetical protein